MLPVKKHPKYLSPSSLSAIENMPNTFYLQRMAPNPYPYEPQSIPAAVGSAFDSIIKIDIVKKLGTIEKIRERLLKDALIFVRDESEFTKADLETMSFEELIFNTSVEKRNREEACEMGKLLYDKYKYNGYGSLEFVDVEIHRNFFILESQVPIFMKLDSIVKDWDTGVSCPHDWKVSGYGSAAGISPKPGYMMLYDKGIPTGGHKEYRKDIPLDEIDKKWATQVCTYGWGIGIVPGTPFPAYIDMLCIRPNNIRVARYRGIITKEFQEETLERYKRAWNSIMSGAFVLSLGESRMMCEYTAQFESWWS